jgi:RES domain-containing protein
MIVYRLSKQQYQKDLSGKGAEIYGGRWNSKGKALLYTSGSRSLALTECLVHLTPGIIPKFILVTLEIPQDLPIGEIIPENLPKNWLAYPPILETQKIGNKFINDNEFLTLKVPSAIVKGEFNYIINPNHKDFNKIKPISNDPFDFDTRLLS